MITLTSLQTKDIVYMEDGAKIGHLTDIELEINKGKVSALVITTRSKIFGMFGEDQEVIIPWEDIVKIGHDIILVKKPSYYGPQEQQPMYPYDQ